MEGGLSHLEALSMSQKLLLCGVEGDRCLIIVAKIGVQLSSLIRSRSTCVVVGALTAEQDLMPGSYPELCIPDRKRRHMIY